MPESDPAATLEIPTDEDVQIIMMELQDMYESVQHEYEHQNEPSEYVARRGSLAMELFSQLADQGYIWTTQ